MLRIYTDENIEQLIADGLKRRNIKAWSAHDAKNLGLTDLQQLEYAVKNEASLFTYDTDFFNISKRWIIDGKIHYGDAIS